MAARIDEDALHTVEVIDSIGRNQRVNAVNEAGTGNTKRRRGMDDGEVAVTPEQEWLTEVYRPLSIRSLDSIIELQEYGRFLLENATNGRRKRIRQGDLN